MCGIVGYVGKNKTIPNLVHCLKKLEYRGYDSAGMAYWEADSIKICKSVGRIANLENKLSEDIASHCGIGHTRWATHGRVNETNSHPHQVGDITIVHNGILENYQELKKFLIVQGYSFQSETDTEVACGYIDYVYQKSLTKNMIKVLTECMQVFEGSYAIVGINKNKPEQLFVMKKDSPLVIGLGESENFIASDIFAYAAQVNKYIILEDENVGIIGADSVKIFQDNKLIDKIIRQVDNNLESSEKDGYEHYMLKEINEQDELLKLWNKKYFCDKEFYNIPDISKYKKIQIVACGTAYHAGLIAKYLLEEYANIEVNVFIASEYRYQKLFIDASTLVIAVSQSGETADTLASIKKVKKMGAATLGIVNVRNSSIAREVDKVIYTEAKAEVAVASTKAYTSQVYIFSLLLLRIIVKDNNELTDIFNNFEKISTLIRKMIDFDYTEIVDVISKYNNIFYLGRNIDYASMMEGALKLKEISYIHSEAMALGELKHGTISLMDTNACVIVLATKRELIAKTISNIKEVKARGATVILLAIESLKNEIDSDSYDLVVWLDAVAVYAQPILNVIPLQMIAYLVAKKLGHDIDKPRNLAKSVTVE